MLSVILPTYNEAANLPRLLEGMTAVLKKGEFEVIVVDDDSPDRTWETAERLRTHYPMLTVIRRVGRRGLSSAVTEGFAAAEGDVLAVMDADLQHDPALLPALLESITRGAQLAVASRYMEGGGVGDWVTGRRLLSRFATFLARTLPPVRVSDPMSGFFMLTASTYEQVRRRVRPTGFKILFEILTHLHPSTRTAEVPLQFKMRIHGESKLNLAVELVFLVQLARVFCMRIQRPLFWLVALAAGVWLLLRVWALAPLYLDASVRTNAQQALEHLGTEHGWLLSDLSVRSVDSTGMRVVRRFHHRGRDETDCFIVWFEDARLTPCAD